MFQPFYAPPREQKERAAGPHRLAAAAVAAAAGGGGGDLLPLGSPRSPRAHSPTATRLAASSSSAQAVSPRHRAAALPAYRSLLGRSASGGRAGPLLPHVTSDAGGAVPAAYTSLDHLRRIASLHQGKHSTVCSFLDTRTGGVVAVKAYYKRTMGRRHYRNVRREVAISRLLAKQRFSGAVRLLGTFEDEGHIYLVQESCAGGDLYRRLVRAGGTLGEAEVCRDVVVPLLLTLTFLHASHIVHRDIKPENVFFVADGSLRLGDFGLSIDARVERPTSRVGTLDYMAPEVLGMLSPDEIARLGLAPHQVGHYGPKVDVWAVGILTYELLCGRPPFEVEDVKQTEQRIKLGGVTFPAHISPLCRSFIQQALTKRPESRPSAAQLFQHPWVRSHYQRLVAEQQQQHAAVAALATAGRTAAAAVAHTPELRRTVSQPPSPSKSVPGVRVPGAGSSASSGAATPTAAASALAPFLPLPQAKLAHKVRLLSPGQPPSSGKAAGPRRRRVSDPVARLPALAPAEEVVATAAAAVAAAADVPPTTPPPAVLPTAASDGAGAVAAAADLDDAAISSIRGAAAAVYETPGTPGLHVTPLPRQRPVVQQRCGPLARSPFLLPLTPGSAGSSMPVAEQQQQQAAPGVPAGPVRRPAAPAKSRFAAENAEPAASSPAVDPGSLSSPGTLAARASSFTGALAKDASSGSLQLAARAASFTSFGRSSSSNIVGLGSRPSSKQLLEATEEGTPRGEAEAAAGAEKAASPVRPLAETLHRLRLL